MGFWNADESSVAKIRPAILQSSSSPKGKHVTKILSLDEGRRLDPLGLDPHGAVFKLGFPCHKFPGCPPSGA